MSDSTDRREQASQHFLRRSLINQLCQFAVWGLVFFVGYRWFGHSEDRWADKPQPTQPPPPTVTPSVFPLPTGASPKDVTDALQQQDLRMVAEVLRKLYAQQLDELKKNALALEEDMNNWTGYSRQLLTTEQGKSIAGDPECMARFKALIDEERPGKEVLDRVHQSMPALTGAMELFAVTNKQNTWKPGPSQDLLDDLTRRVRGARNAYRSAFDAARSIEKLAERNGKTSELALQDALDRVNNEQTLRHAEALKKVHDDAVAKRRTVELESAKENERKATIARDPEALKLLDFGGFTGNSKKFFAASAAKAFAEPGYFNEQAAFNIALARGTYKPGYYNRDGIMELERRNQVAQARFGMSMHELFRTVLCSKANQEILHSDDRLRQEIQKAQDTGDQQRAADLSSLLRENYTLPASKYP